MFTRIAFSLSLFLAISGNVSAQHPWQFRWEKGLQLTYRIKHMTTATEIVEVSKQVSSANLELVNRWQVLDVDAKGVATLSLTLVSMRNEQKRGAGDTQFALVFSLLTGFLVMVVPTWIGMQLEYHDLSIPWYAVTACVIVLGFGFFWRFLQGKWMHMRVIEHTRHLDD